MVEKGFDYHSLRPECTGTSFHTFKEHSVMFPWTPFMSFAQFLGGFGYIPSCIKLFYTLGILVLYLWYIFKCFFWWTICLWPSLMVWFSYTNHTFFFIFMMSDLSFIGPWLWVTESFPPMHQRCRSHTHIFFWCLYGSICVSDPFRLIH